MQAVFLKPERGVGLPENAPSDQQLLTDAIEHFGQSQALAKWMRVAPSQVTAWETKMPKHVRRVLRFAFGHERPLVPIREVPDGAATYISDRTSPPEPPAAEEEPMTPDLEVAVLAQKLLRLRQLPDGEAMYRGLEAMIDRMLTPPPVTNVVPLRRPRRR